jgi:hypothetical protein
MSVPVARTSDHKNGVHYCSLCVCIQDAFPFCTGSRIKFAAIIIVITGGVWFLHIQLKIRTSFTCPTGGDKYILVYNSCLLTPLPGAALWNASCVSHIATGLKYGRKCNWRVRLLRDEPNILCIPSHNIRLLAKFIIRGHVFAVQRHLQAYVSIRNIKRRSGKN